MAHRLFRFHVLRTLPNTQVCKDRGRQARLQSERIVGEPLKLYGPFPGRREDGQFYQRMWEAGLPTEVVVKAEQAFGHFGTAQHDVPRSTESNACLFEHPFR